MDEKVYPTDKGEIHYWINDFHYDRKTLIFLPGLTADHHLFDKQVEAFASEYNILTWDAPGHAASRPFQLDFVLMDKATWLHDILKKERVRCPILIGQSMGGYVAQCFLEQFPGVASGFISIDSAPLKRKYVTGIEIWLLKRAEPMYRGYPWRKLKKTGIEGCSVTEYGQSLMKRFMNTYSREEYCKLAGHGFKMLAEAMEADLPYKIGCPAILICGEKDQAGSAKRYNRRWASEERLPIYWVKDAGHNSNTDRPDEVNGMIRQFINTLN